MEILGLIDVPIWLLLPAVLAISLYLYTRHKQSFFKRLNIPSKETTFFLGDLGETAKKGFHYVDVPMVQRYGKVFGTYLGNTPMLVVTDAEVIKEITVKQFSNFTDRFVALPLDDKWDKTLPNSKGEVWKFQRAKLTPSFTGGKLRNMVGLIDMSLTTLKQQLDERCREGKEFDMTPVLRDFTMSVTCSTGFGLDINAGSDEMKLLTEQTRVFFNFKRNSNIPFLLSIFFPELKAPLTALKIPLIKKEIIGFFYEMFRGIIKDRKSSKTPYRDLMQLMIEANEGETMLRHGVLHEGMTEDELIMNSLQFMIAGFDTTANAMIWTCYLLAIHPDVQEKLIQDIDNNLGKTKPDYDNVKKLKFLEMVIKETLRLYPATQRIDRVPNETIDVCGYHIPKGLDVAIQISAIHMMPEYWPEPEKFKPERFSEENEGEINQYAYLPFGIGPRGCIAKRLAMLEAKMALATILQKYRLKTGPSLEIPAKVNVLGLTKPQNPIYLTLQER